MSVEESIRSKVVHFFSPEFLAVENESHMHSGPASESHFRLVLVSGQFDGKRLLQRHQLLYQVLSEELKGPLHALSMHLYTPDEWKNKGGDAPLSPKCLGGSKK